MLKKVEKHDNIIVYERKLKEMSTNQGGNNQNSSGNANNNSIGNTASNTNTNPNPNNNGVGSPNSIPSNGNSNRTNRRTHWSFFGEICGILVILYGVVAGVIIPISENKHDISDVKNNIQEIEQDLEQDLEKLDNKIDEKIDKLTDIIYDKVAANEENVNDGQAVPVNFNTNYLPEVGSVNENTLSKPKWTNSNEKVATALQNSNIEYTSGDLQNKKIVTMYMEGNCENYFLGQYNKNNQWNGKCILNVYANNELIAILEGTYEDGELKNYKRIACDEEGKWTVTNRLDLGDYKSGETWEYEKNQPFNQTIKPQYFDENKILTVDRVLNSIDKKLVKYYNGNTSDGSYNDNSGTAYIASYNDNGNLRYLYKGEVKDGNGESENGWAVIWLDDISAYRIYEGVFKGGSPTDQDTYKEINEETKAEIESYGFNCPLTGLID